MLLPARERVSRRRHGLGVGAVGSWLCGVGGVAGTAVHRACAGWRFLLVIRGSHSRSGPEFGALTKDFPCRLSWRSISWGNGKLDLPAARRQMQRQRLALVFMAGVALLGSWQLTL
jgi:hypothetical protein